MHEYGIGKLVGSGVHVRPERPVISESEVGGQGRRRDLLF